MTLLPEEVQTHIDNQEVMCMHNWLYSVVPVGAHFDPYLTGFCRSCNNVFSIGIPFDPDGRYVQTLVNIAKESPVKL